MWRPWGRQKIGQTSLQKVTVPKPYPHAARMGESHVKYLGKMEFGVF